MVNYLSRAQASLRMFPGIVLAVVALWLAGCGGNADPVIVTYLPTQTAAVEVGPVAAQTIAHAAVITTTPIPTGFKTTPTSGPSPTSPLGPTLSPAPVTLTATFAPTLARLSVAYFTTDSESVRPGDNVTLFWSVKGANRARIFRVDETGERIYRWDVEKEGKLTVSTRVADREAARFVLTAEESGATVEQALLIPLLCPEVWFFDPAPPECPAEPPQFSSQVEQSFEHGRMIWVAAQSRIYVVFEDGNTPEWAQYPDTYTEGLPEPQDDQVPPPGLERPVRGFGLVWYDNPRVRERLGWAASSEVPYEGVYQADSVEATVAVLYLRMRDGGILALDAETGEWETLAAALETNGESSSP